MEKAKGLIDFFIQIQDPRYEKKSKHKLIDILVIAVCGTICNCDTFVDIEEYADNKIDWFKSFLELPGGIHTHDTFCRVFSLLDPLELQMAFQEWAFSMVKELGIKEYIINIDGKYLHGTKGEIKAGKTGSKNFFGMVNAFSSTAGLALSQLRTDYEKKNEGKATRELTRRMRLKDCTVTLDAMSSQPETTKDIVNQEGDYLIALKKNQREFYKKVSDLLEIQRTSKNSFVQKERRHGRKEVRKCTVKKLSKKFLSELDEHYKELKRPTWIGLKSVCKIELMRELKGKKSLETSYFVTSKDADAEKLLNLARSYWSIENKLNYVLDVSFNEDFNRVRMGYAGENLATTRQLCLNLIKNEKSTKKSVKTKRLKCGWDNDYLMRIILGFKPENIHISCDCPEAG